MLLSRTAFSNVACTEHWPRAYVTLFCFYTHRTFDLFLCFEDFMSQFSDLKILSPSCEKECFVL